MLTSRACALVYLAACRLVTARPLRSGPYLHLSSSYSCLLRPTTKGDHDISSSEERRDSSIYCVPIQCGHCLCCHHQGESTGLGSPLVSWRGLRLLGSGLEQWYKTPLLFVRRLLESRSSSATARAASLALPLGSSLQVQCKTPW